MYNLLKYTHNMSIKQYANQDLLDLIAYQPGKPIEETAREIGMRAEDIVKLASNENSLGPSPQAVEAMIASASGVHIYPDGASFELRRELAERFGVDFEQTVAGSGSSEIIELLCHAFLRPDAELIAAQYSFSMYPIMCKLFGATYVEVPNKPSDWTHDLQGMLDAITEKTRLIFITNPTNPLGTMVYQEEMDAFMAAVPEHVVVAFDEAYYDFSDRQPDSVKYIHQGCNCITLRTFSKAYGLAGLRAGYGIASRDIADLLNKARTPFNMNLMAQSACLAALADSEHMTRSVAMVKAGLEQYYRAFDAMGVSYIRSHTNFLMAKVGRGKEIYQRALAQGVILRDMDSYQLPEYVRITVGTERENARCIEVLQSLLAP